MTHPPQFSHCTDGVHSQQDVLAFQILSRCMQPGQPAHLDLIQLIGLRRPVTRYGIYRDGQSFNSAGTLKPSDCWRT